MANRNDFDHVLFGSESLDDIETVSSRTENLTILSDTMTGRIDLFEKPHQLIGTDEKGLLKVNKDVLAQLSQVDMTINVVGVCGLYRTGKSYLMNWIADTDLEGFDLGDTIQSETKGIWIWCRKHPKKSDQVLVLLDTEGLDDPEKGDPEHDNKLFCLTLLMSSTLIINVTRVFDYSTLDKLAFLASLSSLVKVLDEEADERKNSKAIKVASPHLIMCIRDFFLKSLKAGKALTPDEYLEDKLKLADESTAPKTHVKFNNIKRSIQEYFPKRKCFTIAQPAIGEALQNMKKTNETFLEKNFVEDIKALQSYVYDRKPKYICNTNKKPLDGADLASLITSYVKSLRENSPLKCQDAYVQAAAQRNEKVFKKVLSNFKNDMKKGKQLKNKEELQTTVFLPAFDIACSKYREGSLLINEDEFEKKLMEEMIAHAKIIKVEIDERCMEKGVKILSKMYDDMLEKNKNRYLSAEEGHRNYDADMENLKNDFFRENEKYDKDVLYQCFDKFTKSKSDDKTALYHVATGQRNQMEFKKLHDIICKRMEGQLGRMVIKESEKRRQTLEEELVRLKAENEELVKSVKKRNICSIM